MKYESMADIDYDDDNPTRYEVACAVENDQTNGFLYVVIDDYDGENNYLAAAIKNSDANYNWSEEKEGIDTVAPIQWFAIEYWTEENGLSAKFNNGQYEFTDEMLVLWKLEADSP